MEYFFNLVCLAFKLYIAFHKLLQQYTLQHTYSVEWQFHLLREVSGPQYVPVTSEKTIMIAVFIIVSNHLLFITTENGIEYERTE